MLNPPRKRGVSAKGIFFFLVFILLVAGGASSYFLFFENHAPKITLTGESKHLGKESLIKFKAEDPGLGLRSIVVTAEQNGVEKDIFSRVYPRNGYTGQVGNAEEIGEITFNPEKLGFKEGEVTITLSAYDFSARNFLAGNKTTIVEQMTIDTKAPRLSFLHTEKYISAGGAGIVIYKSDDPEIESGVMMNDHFFKGYPLDNRDNVYICYFALPYDATNINQQYLQATDAAGNQSTMRFSSRIQVPVRKHDRLNISDNFLANKLPELEEHLPALKGSNLEKYLYINGELRRANNAKIAEVTQETSPERMWEGRFWRMPGASPAGYAEYRSYYYEGKHIDNQVHLGVDLASTQQADIHAGNKGVVLYTGYEGIYGNMVIIDHGQGVHSLYSHMSQINVMPGDVVDQNSIIGLTGSTGMSGGDHLHFSVIIGGIFVAPQEWWDAKWLDANIDGPILNSTF